MTKADGKGWCNAVTFVPDKSGMKRIACFLHHLFGFWEILVNRPHKNIMLWVGKLLENLAVQTLYFRKAHGPVVQLPSLAGPAFS